MHIAAWCGDFDFVFTTVEAQRESDSCLPAAPRAYHRHHSTYLH